MRYKDVVREQILHAETAEDAISSDEDGEDGGRGRRRGRDDNGGEGRRGLAYDEEQERLRKGFLGMVAEHDGGGSSGDEGGGSGSGGGDGEGSSEDDGEGLLKVGILRSIGFYAAAVRLVFVFMWCCVSCVVLRLVLCRLLQLFVKCVRGRGGLCVILFCWDGGRGELGGFSRTFFLYSVEGSPGSWL